MKTLYYLTSLFLLIVFCFAPWEILMYLSIPIFFVFTLATRVVLGESNKTVILVLGFGFVASAFMPIVSGFSHGNSSFSLLLIRLPDFLQSIFGVEGIGFSIIYGLIGLGIGLALLLIADRVVIKWKARSITS